MVYDRETAAKRAEAARTNTPGTCQLWTRTMLGAPSAGDRDRDGDADAVDGWLSEPASARHTDRRPPRGTPVAWSGGRNGYGHRAVSLGPVNGVCMVRSTDAPNSGSVGTVPLDWFEKNWSLTYLGWSETITGLPIPVPTPPKPKPEPKPKPTRGPHIDAALADLNKAKAGKGPRGKTIRRARKVLRSLGFLKR